MSDDKLFGEGLPGTGGDFIDVNDVEGHMSTKKIDPKPPTATGGPRGNIPTVAGSDEDTEGHRRGGGGHIPTNAPEPDGLGLKGRGPMPEVAGDDVEGHRRNYNLPGATPDDLAHSTGGKPPVGFSDENDVEGHMGGLTQRRPNAVPEGDGFVKRGPDEMPHGDR